MRTRLASFFLACLVCLLAAASAGVAATERVSVGSDGTQADSFSQAPAVSADGRYVAFVSGASNLGAGLSWNENLVYVRDRGTGKTECVSVSSDGSPANGGCGDSAISADGRYVAFDSIATNLDPEGMNQTFNVFVHDRSTGKTWCLNTSPWGTLGNGMSESPSMSADGRRVAFASNSTGLGVEVTGRVNLYVYDLRSGQKRLVTRSWQGGTPNGDSHVPAISANGRFVAFQSDARNLVPGSSTPYGVYVSDLLTGRTERVGVAPGGQDMHADGASISDDGRYVAFHGQGETFLGRIYIRDRLTKKTILASRGWSADQTPRDSVVAKISGNGRYVAFSSTTVDSPNGVRPGDWRLFVRDLDLNRTSRVDVTSDGAPANGDSGPLGSLAISADGRYIAFSSQATNLVAGDTNGTDDIFVRDRQSFTDVPIYHWAYYEIQACLNSAVVRGYSDGSYGTQIPISRAQLAVYVARALVGGDGNVPAGPRTPSFRDVPGNYWAYDHIEYAKERGVVQGYGDGYRPDETVTRAQLAVFIARAMAGGDSAVPAGPATPRYPDVPDGYWAYKYVEYCASRGVAFGLSDGRYHPENSSKRDETAVCIQRAFGLPM